jgi:PKD repeat protein
VIRLKLDNKTPMKKLYKYSFFIFLLLAPNFLLSQLQNTYNYPVMKSSLAPNGQIGFNKNLENPSLNFNTEPAKPDTINLYNYINKTANNFHGLCSNNSRFFLNQTYSPFWTDSFGLGYTTYNGSILNKDKCINFELDTMYLCNDRRAFGGTGRISTEPIIHFFAPDRYLVISDIDNTFTTGNLNNPNLEYRVASVNSIIPGLVNKINNIEDIYIPNTLNGDTIIPHDNFRSIGASRGRHFFYTKENKCIIVSFATKWKKNYITSSGGVILMTLKNPSPVLFISSISEQGLISQKTIVFGSESTRLEYQSIYPNVSTYVIGANKLILESVLEPEIISSYVVYNVKSAPKSIIMDIDFDTDSIANFSAFSWQENGKSVDICRNHAHFADSWPRGRINFSRNESPYFMRVNDKTKRTYIYSFANKHNTNNTELHSRCKDFCLSDTMLYQVILDSNNKFIEARKIDISLILKKEELLKLKNKGDFMAFAPSLFNISQNNKLMGFYDKGYFQYVPNKFNYDSFQVLGTFSINRLDEDFKKEHVFMDFPVKTFTPEGILSGVELLYRAVYFRSQIVPYHKPNTWWVKYNYSSTPCDSGKVKFSNASTKEFNKWVWYFGDGDSLTTYRKDTIVEHTYSQGNKYFVKVRGFTPWGYKAWFSDSILVTLRPKVNISSKDSVGCQFIALQFTDSSQGRNLYQNPIIKRTIIYGDGNIKNDSLRTLAFNAQPGKFAHTYKTAGTYTVRAQYTDGYCTDSGAITKTIKIRPAPEPGMSFSNELACTPYQLLLSKTYNDPTDSVLYRAQLNNKTIGSSRTEPGSMLIDTAGIIVLYQTLYGPTGCTTHDTATINVKKGFDQGFVPILTVASHANNTAINLSWPAAKDAIKYQVYHQNNYWLETLNTSTQKILEIPVSQAQVFTLKAIDQCDTKSEMSNIAHTVFAKVSVVKGSNNSAEASQITWTPYQDWPGGVQDYAIEYKYKTQDPWQILGTQADTNLQDAQYIQQGEAQKCYRIIAQHSSGLQSVSNEVCLPYQPVLFIPDAISLNGDGLNDDWKITNIGFGQLELQLYNRWGAQIYIGSILKTAYTPTKDIRQGAYAYKITGTDAMGKTYQFSGILQILR